MTARIKRFYSRAELGMRAPRSVSYNITPENGGVAPHYGGGGPNPPPSTQTRAAEIWRSWQRMHMDDNGWADIAYTAGYDNEGNVYAGRGLGVRTAANGSNFGNQSWYAFVWIGGGSAVPSAAAYDALDWLIHWAREKGKAGMDVSPHKRFTSTSCPGTSLTARAALRDEKNIPQTDSAPTDATVLQRGARGTAVEELQRLLNAAGASPALTVDGSFGPATEAAVKAFQTDAGLPVTGVADATTVNALKPPAPTSEENPVMFMVKRADLSPVYKTDGFKRIHITRVERDALLAAGVKLYDKYTTDEQLEAFGPLVDPTQAAT